ncbi:MAG: zinc-binding dehydrogenase [Actinomycetota bacterium]
MEAAHPTPPGQSRRVVVTRHGGPEVLEAVVEDAPIPEPGQVRVQVLCAGVSAFDLMFRRWGRLPGSPEVPFALGEDVVGVVDRVGPGVSSLEEGQVVAGGTWVLGVGGGYAEHVCLPADQLVEVPAGVDPAEAVCLVVNYLTAHQHLHHIGRAQEGERLLVHGAAGGVGSAVLQLGALAGLDMYGTASGANLDLVAELGASPIDHREQDFVEEIQALTSDGVDIVIDPIGGASHLWRSSRALRRGGRLVWLGSAAVETQGLRVGVTSMAMMLALRLLPDGRSAPRCPTMDRFAQADTDWYRTTLAELLDHLQAGRLAPVVAERVPLDEAGRAHRSLEEGGHRGKFVLVTDAYAPEPAGELDGSGSQPSTGPEP